MPEATTPDPVRATRDGEVVELTLAAPPRNVLDGVALAALRAGAELAGSPGVKAILLAAEGPNFSVGASVGEHARAHVAPMLAAFHAAIRALLAPSVPVVAAVRGHCLGGGLEVALCATHLVVAPDARLGQPEIKLGAFAPVASLLLPRRVGQARAEALLVTGRTVAADEALALGLVDAIADDPVADARAWIAAHLGPLSASSLRHATAAARVALARQLDEHLPRLERRYVAELAFTHDAEEGVAAFLAKRPPRWEDR